MSLFPISKSPHSTMNFLSLVMRMAAAPFLSKRYNNNAAAEFKRGRSSLRDDERFGYPKTAASDANVAQLHQIILDHLRIKMRELEEARNRSKERVSHRLNQDLEWQAEAVHALYAAFSPVLSKTYSNEYSLLA
ncbi:hypothetical protein NPIL_95101 [Nephila pilipes]|uniref:Uncharacterized protein n=1 Tax=Nephila pilipes TaxID=299642 RepID=A0A8X6QZQ0_NEPPI|nr:hypothetical protein NPIL_95101 [Nephila pilipes]